MQIVKNLIADAATLVPFLVTFVVVVAGLVVIDKFLKRRWKNSADVQFRSQLIMLALTFAGFLTIILALPIEDSTRGQLLSLIGILLSAAIALSSTTFIGNIMAGIMMKAVRSARPGDFITVAELTGRITEMGLLHTEIQTEFRDLVTVPNLYMVTQPLKVVRASGTIISAEVSLGYDVSHVDVSRILCDAAERSGLKESFVHVRQLGDYSVSYRVAGLLDDVKSLISANSHLREAMLDGLHSDGIEIVSPTFMNTRALTDDKTFISVPSRKARKNQASVAEEVVFDKAEEAASVEDLRKAIERVDVDLAELEKADGETDLASKETLVMQRERLLEQFKEAEGRRKAADIAEHVGKNE